MFTMLLPMRMEESSLSYCSAIASTRAAAGRPPPRGFSNGSGSGEENAVSDAEKKAEKQIKYHQHDPKRKTAIVHGEKNHTQLSVLNFCLNLCIQKCFPPSPSTTMKSTLFGNYNIIFCPAVQAAERAERVEMCKMCERKAQDAAPALFGLGVPDP